MARDINLLYPTVKALAEKLVAECEKQELKIKITDTLRTQAEQNALYAQGRTKPGNKVTNAKYPQSNHCWGIAFDFCRNDGQGAYNDNDGFFSKVGQVGKALGLDWGGDWTSFVDKPHFEYDKYGTWRALQSKYGTPAKFLATVNPAAATTSASSSSNVIKKGNRGDAVKDLQNQLNALGYNCGTADGIFGSNTLAAVEAFQKDNGLTVDGIVGDKTREALKDAKSKAETTAKENNTTTKGVEAVREFQRELNAQFNKGLVVDGIWGKKTEAACVEVRKKAEGNLTELIQQCLINKGYDCGEIDGKFGVKTETAVMAFQKAKGLTIDGIVGKQTWKALLH